MSPRLRRKRIASYYNRPGSKRPVTISHLRTFVFCAARGESCSVTSICAVGRYLLVAYASDGPFHLPIQTDQTGRAKWTEHDAAAGQGMVKRGAVLIDPLRYNPEGGRPLSPTRRSVLPATMLRLGGGSGEVVRWPCEHKIVCARCLPGISESSRDVAIAAVPACESLIVFQRAGAHGVVAPASLLALPDGVVPLTLAIVPQAPSGNVVCRCTVGTVWHGVVVISVHTMGHRPLQLTADLVLSAVGQVPGCYFPVTYVSCVQCEDHPNLQIRASSHYSMHIVCWDETDWSAPCFVTPGWGSSIAGLVSGSAPLLASVTGRAAEALRTSREALRLPDLVTQVTPTSVLPPWRRDSPRSGCGLGEIAAFALLSSRRVVVAERFRPNGKWRIVADYSPTDVTPASDTACCSEMTWLELSGGTQALVCLYGNELVVLSLAV